MNVNVYKFAKTLSKPALKQEHLTYSPVGSTEVHLLVIPTIHKTFFSMNAEQYVIAGEEIITLIRTSFNHRTLHLF